MSRGIRQSTILYRSARHLRAYAEAIWGGERIGTEWGANSDESRLEYEELDSLASALRSMGRYAQWEQVNAERKSRGLSPLPLRVRRERAP